MKKIKTITIILLLYGKEIKKKQDESGKKYPNYTGSLTVNGKKLNVSVWVNTDRKEGGQQPIMSGKIQEPMQKKTEEIPF